MQALNGLRLCGYALRSDMERIISGNRVAVFLLRGYLETKCDIHNREVLTYTAKGKSLIQKLEHLQGRAFYPRQSNAVAHDTALFGQYIQLTPEERMSALSETETRDLYRETLEQLADQAENEWDRFRKSIPDMVYTTTEGETIAIEITTNNYTSERIEAKEATAAAIGAELHLIKI